MCIKPSIFRQSGISLVELIMFIVIVSIALTGVTLVMNLAPNSADTILRKQALAAAESLLEEIEAQPVSGVTSCIASAVVASTRAFPYKVCDYNTFATSGVFDMDGTAVSGLNDYNVSVAVSANGLGNIPAASAVKITVTVTDPVGNSYDATGYRADY